MHYRAAGSIDEDRARIQDGVMEATEASLDRPIRRSPWRGVLLLIVGSLVVGLGPAGVLIGLALLAFVLDKTAPKKLDELIDFLTF